MSSKRIIDEVHDLSQINNPVLREIFEVEKKACVAERCDVELASFEHYGDGSYGDGSYGDGNYGNGGYGNSHFCPRKCKPNDMNNG